MAVKFAETMNAISKGLETIAASKGAHLVEDWESALSDVDTPGAKGILRDLESLRRQLEKSEPDGERIATLLHRLGEATTKIADRADGSNDKLQALGEALTKAGQ